MKNFNSSSMGEEPSYQSSSQINLQAHTPRLLHDEMSQDLNYLSREAPLDGGESTFGAYSQLGGSSSQHLAESPTPLDQLAPDNVELVGRAPTSVQQAGFLVSFMVDARGGAMRGCRHSGVRVIIPAGAAQAPTRITCRYLRRERLVHPPPLMEGEACASKIMEVGPAGARFLSPVLLEVPHFASLRGQEREVIVLRSDSGEVWREHLMELADEKVAQRIADQLPVEAREPVDENREPGRLTRIVTTEFPQYFAIISRVRQQVTAVGPEGALVHSAQLPKVQATFTEGALTKRIKIGLQPNPAEQPLKQTQAQEPQDNEIGKRGRRRFLACFGANAGSLELLAEPTQPESGGSSTADSPASRRLCLAQTRRASELVPEDYYIEREPPLILNLEPKTYGKRLASSSVQTDGPAAQNKARSLLRRRKHKPTQLNICTDQPHTDSTSPEPESLDELKRRTCTIQTDSDSVVVNYVLAGQPDDGYVSGSGELAAAKQRSATLPGLCGLSTKQRLSVDSSELGLASKVVADERASLESSERPSSPSSGRELKASQKAAERARKQADKARRKRDKQARKAAKRAAAQTTQPDAELVDRSTSVKFDVDATTTTCDVEPKAVVSDEPEQDQASAELVMSELAPHPNQVGAEAVESADRLRAAQLDQESQEKESAKLKQSLSESSGKSKAKPKSAKSKSDASFLGRLFKRRSTPVTEPVSQPAASTHEQQAAEPQVPLILSEMYPSNPDEADGEMILEVNVPKELVDKRPQPAELQSEMSEPPASPTLVPQSTTIDETLASQADLTMPADEQRDDQATLVTVDDEDDDQATDNAVSQVQDMLELEPSRPLNQQPEPEPEPETELTLNSDKPEVSIEPSTERLESSSAEEAGLAEPAEPAPTPVESGQPLSKAELKARRELEKKLESEAKRRLKEEEKTRKAEQKEAKKRAKDEAKRAVKQAEQEAKKAKQRAKDEAKRAKHSKKEEDKRPELLVNSVPPTAPEAPVELEDRLEEAPLEEAPLEEAPLDGLTPVSEETQVERIVEEVMGDDGVLTKTTKTIETKLVTLRQEELRVSEHRELPLEEYLAEQHQSQLEAQAPVATEKLLDPDLANILSAPSCFSADCDLALTESKRAKLSAKQELKKRLKLNERLVKQAKKLALAESKKAQQCAQLASKQLEVSRRELDRAQRHGEAAAKHSATALKEAAKGHKKMDKRDKKLAKRQKKIDKKEKELQKRADKLAKKEAKRAAKLARQSSSASRQSANSPLDRKSSAGSRKSAPGSTSRKSIKLEDIGEPVLRSSSRLSIGVSQPIVEPELVEQEAERMSPLMSDDEQVEMSLDIGNQSANLSPSDVADDRLQLNAPTSPGCDEAPEHPVVDQCPDETDEQDEEIDVVSDLPQIGAAKTRRRSQEELES